MFGFRPPSVKPIRPGSFKRGTVNGTPNVELPYFHTKTKFEANNHLQATSSPLPP
jgi:hypothetical protein